MASFFYSLIVMSLIFAVFLICRHKDESIIQNLYRWKALFISYLIGFPIITVTLNNDFWFIQPLGHVINTQGFVNTEPLSMHSGLDYVCQQWAFASITDLIYSFSGVIGCMIFAVLLSYLLEYVIYKICLILSKDKTKSLIITALFISLCMGQLTTRPYVVTAILLGLEILFLELYIQKQNWKYLIALPVISLVNINVQCSMWLMQFVFLLPYFVDAIRFPKKEKYVVHDNISILHLCITSLFMFICGFINPYGLDAITYVFNSYGVEIINKLVKEMQAFSIDALFSPYDYILLLLVGFVLIIAYKNKKTYPTLKLRYVFLFLGTLFLTLLNIRSQILFVVASPAGAAYLWGLEKPEYNTQVNPFEKTIKIIFCFIIIISGIFINSSNWINSSNPEKVNSLYSLVNFIDEHFEKDIKIFTTYDDGGYLEYRGYKPYIDARAEVFLKSNNHKYDYFKEFYDLYIGTSGNDFYEKYNFDIIIAPKGLVLTNNLEKDNNYIKIFTTKDKSRSIFVHKSNFENWMSVLKKTPIENSYD